MSLWRRAKLIHHLNHSHSFETFPGVGTPPGATSYAAPQVAGLAALMLSKNSALNMWPEAMRAIIMASATHDITDPTDTTDRRDGTGAIVGDQAVAAATTYAPGSTTCSVSCWWGTFMSGVPRGSNISRTFTAQPGERVRVAISWWASPDGSRINDPSYLNIYALDTDYDLRIKDPFGNYITWSSYLSMSFANNYELVEFNAPHTGTYTIEIYNSFNSSPSAVHGAIGIALVKILTWQSVPGSLKQVSVACDGTVWAVNDYGWVYRWNPDSGVWVQLPGSLKQISVSRDGDVWGVSVYENVFRR